MELDFAPDLIDTGEFDLDRYLAQFDPRLLASEQGRRVLTRLDPLLFALLYLPHHLKGEETGGRITLSEFHLDVIRRAKSWVIPPTEPAQYREAYIAPRAVGKTTWFFLILPMWAAAHRHQKFIAAFADTATQAELHLQTFKQELERNRLLRNDFPALCCPAKRPSGHAVSDTRAMLICESGFTFAARGIDTSSLGLKVGQDRPTLIVLDDCEPGAEHYSPTMKQKRLETLSDSILPLNVYARVVLVGTVTMFGSIVHDLVRSITQPAETEPWIKDENFQAHYYPAIIVDPQIGQRRSIWPAKWSLEFLESIEHTRSFKKNYNNDPMGADGPFWSDTDFRYGKLEVLTHQLISIDPAVTTKEKSDFTAIAVIGRGFQDAYGPPTNYGRDEPIRTPQVQPICVIREILNLQIPPGQLLVQRVQALCVLFPGVAGLVVESNQGGDVWTHLFAELGLPVRTVHNTEPKPVRAARLLRHYQQGHVLHERPFPPLEGQMVGFPMTPHDDLVDVVGTGVGVFLTKPTKNQPRSRSVSYI